MPNIITLRLRPDFPQSATNFTNNYLSGLVVEIRELGATYASAPSDSAAFTSTVRIVQHELGGVDQSVATAVLQVPTGAITSGKADLRITILRGGTEIVDIASYGMDIYNVGTLPAQTSAAYQALGASSYIALPGSAPVLSPTDMVAMPSGGQVPVFTTLETAVSSALVGAMALDNLSLTESQTIAASILLPGQTNPMPAPSSATLEAMYTGTNFSPILTQNRNDYESIVGSPTASAADQGRLASYIYGLSAAHHCANVAAAATQVRFRFPVRPQFPANSALITEMEVVLQHTSGGAMQPSFAVHPAYYYAHSANLPDSVTPAQRCNMAHSDTRTTLVNKFQQADADGVINIGGLPINAHQAARRMDAHSTPSSSTPVCTVPASGSLYNLINEWVIELQSDDDIFWLNHIAAFQAAHLELVSCNLTDGYTMSLPTAAPISATSAENLENRTEQEWGELFAGYTPPEPLPINVQLFLTNVKKYFVVQPSPLPVPAVDPIVPANQGTGDPIQGFIKCYDDLATPAGLPVFQFGTAWDADLFKHALDCVFPNDRCMQEWLLEKIDTIVQLLGLTADCPDHLQFSIMEALYAKGFSDVDGITALYFADFKEALVGTVAYDCAEEIFVKAGGDPDNKQETLKEDFTPVNPDGKLVNCIPPKHQSLFSPVSYLHDLIHLHKDSTCEAPHDAAATDTLNDILKIHRGDIGSMDGSYNNLCVPIPLIDEVNEILEYMVDTGNHFGIIHNTGEDEIHSHKLLQKGAKEQPVGDNLPYHHEPVQLLEAMPEHSSPTVYSGAYDKLKKDFSNTCCLPYNQPLDVSRSYLASLGVSRYEKMRRFRKEITEFVLDPAHSPADFQSHLFRYPVKYDTAREYLLISTEEYDCLYTQNLVKLPATGKLTYYELYGYTADGNPGDWDETLFIHTVSNLCEFLKRTCLTYCEFLDLWRSGFVAFDSNDIQNDNGFPDCEPCDCKRFQLGHMDGAFTPLTINELKKLIVFIRLWHKLQKVDGAKYSFAELRDICNVLKLFNGANINKDFIRKLAAFQMLRDDFSLELTDEITPGAVDVDRTRLLSLWVGPTATYWDWAVTHLLDQIQYHHEQQSEAQCRPPEFIKILQDNLDSLSLLAGYDPAVASTTWHTCPTHTLKFAEILSKIYRSKFSVGELFFLFTTNGQLIGDDPLPQQTNNEAVELPFDLPDNEEDYSLWKLREQILTAESELTEEEIGQWNWLKIDATLREKFGYEPTGIDHLKSIGTHFFPNTLEALGYTITNADKQYRTGLSQTDTAPLMWNTPPNGPFRYDPGSQELWAEIALTDEGVIDKLSRIRDLGVAERQSVSELYFRPRLDLAHFSFIFSNFTEAQERMIQVKDETQRWEYFQKQFALFHKRCEVIATHLAEHVINVTGQGSDEGIDLAWKILRELLDDENKATSSWEDDGGEVPDVCWNPQPNGGAFAALLGLRGTGLEGTFTPGGVTTPSWKEVRGVLTAFGPEENHADSPIPTVIPDMNFALPAGTNPRFATIRNGFAIENPDGDLLGGAQGYTVCWEGVLMVENGGSYNFRAGAPTPGSELPDFEKAKHAQWLVEIKRGQKVYKLLSHNMDGETAPADCSASVQLKRGAYDISIKYIQPEPTFESREEGCPQMTGFQIKWNGLDTNNELSTISYKHLYLKKKEGKLLDDIKPISSDDIDAQPIKYQFIWHQHHSSIRAIRRTYIRAFEALLFCHRFQLSAQPQADSGQSEIGYMLSQPEKFQGYSYFGSSPSWSTHKAYYDFNLFPVLDNYCTPDDTDDKRVNPSVKRMQALFDWWMRMCEYTELREKTSSAPETPVWLAFHEAKEKHPDTSGDLLYHLGIDLSHSTIVTKFHDSFAVSSEDLEDERWAIRVCQAELCLQKILCHFSPKDISVIRPDLWVSGEPEVVLPPPIEMSGNENLMEFVHDSLLENETPRQYDVLKQLNDALRKNARNALVCYLTSRDRVQMPKEFYFDGDPKPVQYATEAKHLSELLKIDVEVGCCQKASRVEEATTAVQLFVQRARLGLETGLIPGNGFIHLWDKTMMSFNHWVVCKRREAYQENYIDFIEVEKARKSESFRLLESQLKQEKLSVPVSGSSAILASNVPTFTGGPALLQKQTPAKMEKLEPAIEGFDVLGTPEHYWPSWLSSTKMHVDASGALVGKNLPFWIEAAIKLKAPFVRLAAATTVLAATSYDCQPEGTGCCADCGTEHEPMIDEYYFWLIDGRYYEYVSQDATWAGWTDPAASPSLEEILHMNSKPLVYLAWSKVHNGEFQQMRWASEGVSVDGLVGDYQLDFDGRLADTLSFTIKDNSTTFGGFRYNLVSNDALVYPDVGLTPVPARQFGGLNAVPTFVLFEPGAPIEPLSLHASISTIAGNLRLNCRFEDALKAYHYEGIPVQSNNFWNANNIKERSILLQYLETLRDWGKALMRKNSPESFQQARLIFDFASKLLGNCPKSVLAEDKEKRSILEFEPASLPINPRLLCLYDHVQDNLELIHNCLNAYRLQNGTPNKDMPYWGNSSFAKCGQISFSQCVEEETWCMPESPYRFEYLLNKSLELAREVSSLGGQLLSAFEKADGEYLSNLRAGHEKQILELGLSIRNNQLRSADFEVQSLQKTLLIAEMRKAYFEGLIAGFPIAKEIEYEAEMWVSLGASLAAQISEGIAQALAVTPDVWVGVPIPVTLTQPPGPGVKGAAPFSAAARISNMIASAASTLASLNLTKAGWIYRMKEWVHTVATTTEEIEQIRRQLRGAERRRDISLTELNNHQRQIEQSAEIHDFLHDKFTSQELYLWMQKEISELYYMMYRSALHTARQAQVRFNIEVGYESRDFLKDIVWDSMHAGLHIGDRLQHSLRHMECAYMDQNKREYELTKHLSLKTSFGREFLNLRETGVCEIIIPEWLLDLETPGDYMRRIKSVSMSIPCVAGPYTRVNSKLTLLSSKTRISPELGCSSNEVCCEGDTSNGYTETKEDRRFVSQYLAKEAISTSTGQNDSGTFELNFRDERLQHFEFQGVISCWRIELPKENNFFDISSVNDVILHINYTAREGGDVLRQKVQEAITGQLPDNGIRLFEVDKEFPNEWHLFNSKSDCEEKKKNELLLKVGRNHFPYLPYESSLKVNRLEVFFKTCEKQECKSFKVELLLNPSERDTHPEKCETLAVNCIQRSNLGCLYHGVIELDDLSIAEKQMTELGILSFPEAITCIENMYLLIGYDDHAGSSMACT